MKKAAGALSRFLPPCAAAALALFLLAAPAYCLDQGRTGAILKDLLGRLASDDPSERERAFAGLYAEGDDAVEALKAAVNSADPEVSHAAKRLLFMIRWRLDPGLAARIGPLWDDFETLPPQERILRVLETARLAPEDALKILKRVAEIDPHPAVREQALKTMALSFAATLTRLNSEGCDFMRTGRYAEAEERFHRMLEIDERNDTALYNLACSKSLQGMIEEAFELLANAVENGYRGFDHARTDPDLENIRKADLERFEEILSGEKEDRPGAGEQEEDR